MNHSGLGIRRPHVMNSASLMKLGFNLISNRNSLWAQVLLGKYNCQSFADAKIANGQRVSRLWRAVVQLKNEVLMGLKWAVEKMYVFGPMHGLEIWGL